MRSSSAAAFLEICYLDGRYDAAVSGSISLYKENCASCDFRVKYGERPMYFRGGLSDDIGENDYLLIRNIKITLSPYDMKNFLFRTMTIFLLVDLQLFLWNARSRFLIDDETMQNFKVLLFLTAFSSIPLMAGYLLGGHDLLFHLSRIEGLKAGLESGMFPVRIQPHWLGGHGYAVSVLYGDLLLYLPAMLRAFGVSIPTAYSLYILLINTITVFLAYYCFSNMSNKKTGLICTAIYSLNIYRLVCIYTRAAVGEYTAMAFIPLVIYGIWEIYTLPEESKEHAKGWIPFALGCNGIFLSHIITTEISAFFIILTCVILWKKTLRKKVFPVLVKAAAMTVCLSLWFLIPFMDFMSSGIYFARENFLPYSMEERGTFFAQLFMIDYSVSGGSFTFLHGAASEMPLTIGLASMFVLIGWFYFCVGRKREKSEKKQEYFIVFLTLLSILMTTMLFPYSWMADKLPILKRLISVIQYPWRFFTMAGAFCALLLCLILQKEWIGSNAKKVFTGLLISMAFVQSLSYMSRCLNEFSVHNIYQGGNLSGYNVSGGEYLPTDSEHEASLGACIEQLTYDADSVRIDEWHRENYAVAVSAANVTDEIKQVEVPLLFAKGYHAVTDSSEQLPILPGDTFRISVSVPPDFTGSFKVEFQEPWYWRVCEIISLLALAGLIVYWRYDKQSRKEKMNLMRGLIKK